jgi:hypothetical protein
MVRKSGEAMTGPFVELSEPETSRTMLVNAALVTCVVPHARMGSFLYFTGGTERFEVEETPAEVSALLRAAGVVCQRRDEG